MHREKEKMLQRLSALYPGLKVHNYFVRNDFFGSSITVSGLLTGQDIVRQLEGRPLGDTLYLPENLLRAGTEVLLDDMTLPEIAAALQVIVDIVKSDGWDFVSKVIGSDPG